MPYKIDWYIDQQIVFTRMWGDLDAETYSNYFRDCYTVYDQSDRPLVHSIVDATAVTSDANLLEIKRTLPKTSHPRSGWTLSVVANADNLLIRFVVNALSNAANQRLRQFSNVDEAIDFLRRIDPTITWQQAHPEVLQSGEAELSH